MMVWKMFLLFQGCILRFHVNLQGCTSFNWIHQPTTSYTWRNLSVGIRHLDENPWPQVMQRPNFTTLESWAKNKVPWEPKFPSFLGVMSPIYWGFKTFIFHGFGVQRYLYHTIICLKPTPSLTIYSQSSYVWVSNIFGIFTRIPKKMIQFDGRIFFKGVGSTTN